MNSPSNGTLKVEIASDYEAMSQQAAARIIAELKRRPDLLLCASAGGTPQRTYELLAARQARQPKLFKRLRVIEIDEWCGLPPGSPASCQADLRTKLLNPLGIDSTRYVGFRTEAAHPKAECISMT